MTPRQLVRLAVALVVVLALWGGAALARRSTHDVTTRLTLPSVIAAKVDSVTIAHGGDTIRLARKGDAWKVDGQPAAAEPVKDLLTALSDTSSGELVAEHATSHSRLGVDSAGRRVRAFAGRTVVRDLIAGNQGEGFGSGYVRQPGADATFLMRGSLAELARRPLDEWRDRRIATVHADSIAQLEVSRGAKRFVAKHQGTSWSVNGAHADSAAMANWLQDLRDISASGFPSRAQLDSVKFAPPKRRLRALNAAGKPLLALVFDSTPGNLWVRADTGGIVYRMDQWTADRLTPADSTLRPHSDTAVKGAKRKH